MYENVYVDLVKYKSSRKPTPETPSTETRHQTSVEWFNVRSFFVTSMCPSDISPISFGTEAQQCVSRKYDQDSIVCVCNATYCDLIEPTTVDQLTGDVARHYISTIEGRRLEPTTLHFSTKTLDIANATYFQVNKNVTYQQILGFGGAMTDSAAINIDSLSEEAQQNFLRYERGDVELEEKANKTSGTAASLLGTREIPYLKRAQSLSKRPLKLFTTAWSAPDWMKNIVTMGNSSLKPEYYQLWADYYVK
uniref:Glucosylceramidase n=1 Tax=Timema shepardi TaxID=629360 RepID=A0A7R9AUX7_TIMSH|nr:unnamed protein product [Timema shepardi]